MPLLAALAGVSAQTIVLPDSGLEVSYTLRPPTKVLTPDGDDPLLFFLHPFTNSGEYWQPQIEDPAIGGRFWTITCDAPGHGNTPTYGKEWTIETSVESIITILKAHVLPGRKQLDGKAFNESMLPKYAVLVGDSMGGFTALRAALADAKRAKDIKEDPIVSGVVFVGSSVEREHDDFIKQYTDTSRQLQETAKNGKPAEAIRTLAVDMAKQQYGVLDNLAEAGEWFEWGTGVIERSLTRSFAAVKAGIPYSNATSLPELQLNLEGDIVANGIEINFKALLHREGIEQVLSDPNSGLRCPVLIIHGTKDRAYPIDRKFPETTKKSIEAGGGEAQIELIKGGPHFLTVTHWKTVDPLIVKWIDAKARPSS